MAPNTVLGVAGLEKLAWIHPDQAKARKAIAVPLKALAALANVQINVIQAQFRHTQPQRVTNMLKLMQSPELSLVANWRPLSTADVAVRSPAFDLATTPAAGGSARR